MSMIKCKNAYGKLYEIKSGVELGSGGEGTIFEIDSNTVAKIYHDGVKPITQKKFNFLSKLDPNYFIAPLELLYNSKSEVIGYTMKYLDQTFFPLSNIYSKNFCQSNGIDKKIKIKIIEKLISAVKYAHNENVVIGDLNPFNIMVNNSGVVKFIDVDSYETPGFPHSHVLLDEIRDYYYQGRVSKDSDYFALSILSFNMLSFLHPFKGMHKTYKKLSDRMINKLPVFINDPDITIPKCYEPIQDLNFINQFKKFYLNGERFLLSLSNVNDSIIASPLPKPSLIKSYEQNDLLITIINETLNIVNVFFLDKQGCIETDSEYIIYNSNNKGYLSQVQKISKVDWDKIFVGNENVLAKKGNELWLIKKDNSKELIKSFKFPNRHIITQMGNVLVVIGPDDMYKLFIDQVGAGNIVNQHTPVYGKSFNNQNGLVHNSGGKQNIFFNSGKGISISQSPVSSVTGIVQQKNIGIIQFLDNKILKTKFFKIENLKTKLSNLELDGLSSFAFIPNPDNKDGTVFISSDDKIELYRTQDFEKIGEMNCSLITSQTSLFKCNSGIVAWDGNMVTLLNKK